ncbi:hypothetical protein [Nannocystis sp. SCPEA4]|uniref:hypothetical protein n=1 Tax=Nannocystis sp. SCPEA4 TaxID=2996787 RepID=UPI00226FF90C|nr:hypothetical protein [Nannocystis sp. SCPEA4]MCY1055334.1 hypothetical protein [Nannocystis sp. SCPEA4]
MLARSCLTLLLCCTSTLAAAKEPAQVAAAQGPVARPLAARNVEPANQPTPLIPPGREPDLVPPDYKRDWQSEQRFLQAGTGVSWALAGLGTIGMAIPLGMLNRCNQAADRGAMIDCSQERRTAGIMAPILGVLTIAAIVPAVMFTRRLVKHDNKKPGKQRRTAFGVNAGGLALQF